MPTDSSLGLMASGFVPRPIAESLIRANHYTGSYPSGWARAYLVADVLVVFAIPANKNLEAYLFRESVGLLELSRLWAPDGHAPNALTAAISGAVKLLRADAPDCQALVSFADPNVGHHGGVYRAASWLYLGQSEESRGYRKPNGKVVARRAFHSGSTSRIPGLPSVRVEGKHRYVRCLTRRARALLNATP